MRVTGVGKKVPRIATITNNASIVFQADHGAVQ